MDEHIKRSTVLALIEEKQKELCPLGQFSRNAVSGSDRETFDGWQELINEIEQIPADVVHGQWDIRYDGTYGRARAYCTACGKHSGIGGIRSNQLKPYCPNCGAKMEGAR